MKDNVLNSDTQSHTRIKTYIHMQSDLSAHIEDINTMGDMHYVWKRA
jgi:hypothetical protein